jgi:hypothetical protein
VGRGRRTGGNSVGGQCLLLSLPVPRYDSLRENHYVNIAVSCMSRHVIPFLLILWFPGVQVMAVQDLRNIV